MAAIGERTPSRSPAEVAARWELETGQAAGGRAGAAPTGPAPGVGITAALGLNFGAEFRVVSEQRQ